MSVESHGRVNALRLAARARLERNASTGMCVLRHPSGAVHLNEAAAAILALCDGRNTRLDVLARFGGAVDPQRIPYVNSFLDAARKRAWITEGELHRAH